MYCQYCGKEVQNGTQVCMSCGCAVPRTQTPPPTHQVSKPAAQQAAPPSTKQTTQQAEKQWAKPTVIIVNDGQQAYLTEEQSEISPKKGVVALILVFLVGTLGIHRFYVGKIGSGIGMLLLFLTGYSFFIAGYIPVVMNGYDGGFMGSDVIYLVNLVCFGIGGLLLTGYSIWWLIDLIKICISKFKDKQGRIVKL